MAKQLRQECLEVVIDQLKMCAKVLEGPGTEKDKKTGKAGLGTVCGAEPVKVSRKGRGDYLDWIQDMKGIPF